MDSQWILKDHDEALSAQLSSELNIERVAAKILVNRGITTKEEGADFLSPRLSNLPNPYHLPDMERATERIEAAIQADEKIAIFGDYDSDGITSTSLLTRFFRECGVAATAYIPNRISEGYGLNKTGIDELKNRGVSLIITADNGTNATDEVAYAKGKGIDIIITDHHTITHALPDTIVLNPRRLGEESPFAGLAGVGVAFYLAAALRMKLKERILQNQVPDIKKLLDLVAVGTIADIAPMTGINRTLVKHGIGVLRKSGNLGLTALAEAAGTPLHTIDTTEIAFRLSPRINAAGRLGFQNLAFQLLTTEDPQSAKDLALRLSQMNSERQTKEQIITEEAKQIAAGAETASLVLWSEAWHAGIIGIVAGRLAEAYRKPTILISLSGPSGRGSARSVGNFNIMAALKKCERTLLNYGGHRQAAGFDIKVENLHEFQKIFESYVSEHLKEEDRKPSLLLDSNVEMDEIHFKLIEELEQLSPFGAGNPSPLLAISACSASDIRRVGTNHLKLKIRGNITTLDAIGFNMGDRALTTGTIYQFAGTPERNEWNGRSMIQFRIKDIRPA